MSLLSEDSGSPSPRKSPRPRGPSPGTALEHRAPEAEGAGSLAPALFASAGALQHASGVHMPVASSEMHLPPLVPASTLASLIGPEYVKEQMRRMLSSLRAKRLSADEVDGQMQEAWFGGVAQHGPLHSELCGLLAAVQSEQQAAGQAALAVAMEEE